MAPLLLVTGCLAQSSIQASYMDAQDDCRSQAEDKVSDLPDEDEMSARQRSAALVDQFSDCMNKAGWHVARPAKPTVVAQPAQPLPGQPSGVITTVRPPVVVQQPQPVVRAVTPAPVAPAAAPVVQQPVHNETTPLQPSRGTTPLNPTDQPPPASYEPSGASDATDLNAVGRHF